MISPGRRKIFSFEGILNHLVGSIQVIASDMNYIQWPEFTNLFSPLSFILNDPYRSVFFRACGSSQVMGDMRSKGSLLRVLISIINLKVHLQRWTILSTQESNVE